MKFACACGAIIRDQTDYLPYKAHVVSDQDIDDALDRVGGSSGSWFPELTRTLYECVSCGRLWMQAPGNELRAFVPEGHAGRVLSPKSGDKWKAPLRAQWNDTPVVPGALRGVLSITRGVTETVLSFGDWTELESAYHRVLKERRDEGTLRDALLSKNGARVHFWKPDSE